MPARFECPQCFYAADVRSALKGSKVKCPECGTPVRVGSRQKEAPPVVQSSTSASSQKSRSKGKKSGDLPVTAVAAGGAGLVVVIALAFLAGRAGRQPQPAPPPNPVISPASVAAIDEPPAAAAIALAEQPPSNPGSDALNQAIHQPAVVAGTTAPQSS
ncbi:MAG: hypothetical protein KF861_03735, partial [Planctomycetaceae bacterium]|nr:hypothetical protein [Planctomycetaceae bacterium]